MRGFVRVLALLGVVTMSACGVAGADAGAGAPVSGLPTAASSTLDSDGSASGVGGSVPMASAAAPDESASPSTGNQTVPADVDWDTGKGTPENPALDPSPIGWYESAFGGPADAQGKVLYVTFDDGPAPATPQVLALLKEHGAQATFFVIGSSAAAAPDVVARVHAAGHAIGNHTYTHSDLTSLTPDEVADELNSTIDAAPYIGSCMRPPYGAIDEVSGEIAEQLGLQPIMWTGQAFDWRPPPVEKIVADIKSVTKPGAVILLHDGSSNRDNTVAALARLLPYWEKEGYQLKAIPACL